MVLDGRRNKTVSDEVTTKALIAKQYCDPCDDCTHWIGKMRKS